MAFLLDTNVVSERSGQDLGSLVIDWIEAQTPTAPFFLSAQAIEN